MEKPKTHGEQAMVNQTSNPYAGQAFYRLGGFATRCFAGSTFYDLGCYYTRGHQGKHSNDPA